MVIVEVEGSGLSETMLSRFAHRARKAAGLTAPVSVLITGNQEMRRLNASFRKKDKPTDVLSFPVPAAPSGKKDPRHCSGDLAVSWEMACASAARLGHSPEDEVKILILHGMLHLAGYDHEKDNGEMARVEAQLRSHFQLPVGLLERGAAPGKLREISSRRPASETPAAGTRHSADAGEAQPPRRKRR